MGTLIHGVRSAIEYILAPMDAVAPIWGLTLFSVITGVIMLWVVGRTTPQRRIERARARMAAAIYELRLYLDSPRRVFASQGRLLAWSFVYTGYMMPALLILGLPLGLFYLHLEPRYGLAPLPLNTPVVVVIETAAKATDAAVDIGTPPPGVRVTAPPLRLQNQVYVRVVITEPGDYELPIRAGAVQLSKRLSADPERTTPVAPDRCRGLSLLACYGDEAPVPDNGAIVAVTVPHPGAPQSWLGMAMPWWVYWLIVATVVALALRRPMGVTL